MILTSLQKWIFLTFSENLKYQFVTGTSNGSHFGYKFYIWKLSPSIYDIVKNLIIKYKQYIYLSNQSINVYGVYQSLEIEWTKWTVSAFKELPVSRWLSHSHNDSQLKRHPTERWPALWCLIPLVQSAEHSLWVLKLNVLFYQEMINPW